MSSSLLLPEYTASCSCTFDIVIPIPFNILMKINAVNLTRYFPSVPPLVVPLVKEVIGNENLSATLQFRIDNADPRVMLSGLRWFYSERFADDISDDGVEEITNLTNRTIDFELVTSFSSDGTYFNITVVNIKQDRLGGEDTDEGRYFLQATNPAGVSVDFIDLVVHGKHSFRCELL